MLISDWSSDVCSSDLNGNLLYHLQPIFSGWTLEGGDIFPNVIEACRRDPDLAGIRFDTLNILKLAPSPSYDVIVVNAVLSRFDDAEFQTAVQGISGLLKPGGHFVGFEWYHGFQQTLRIVEETPHHPEGLVIHMRSQFDVADVMR